MNYNNLQTLTPVLLLYGFAKNQVLSQTTVVMICSNWKNCNKKSPSIFW